MKEKIKQKITPVHLALIILLVVQFCLIAYSNITQIGKNLDGDSSRVFNHIAEMWRQKTLFLPDWSYPSTLEWDCSSILAFPFYMLTNNIILSFGLANIILLAVFLYVVFFLFKDKDLLYPLLCVNLIIIPYRVGMLEYYNMMFFGAAQYIIKVAVPMLLVGLIISGDRDFGRQQKFSAAVIVPAIVYLALLLVSSMSSSVYVAVCGIFPAFFVYIGDKFFRWERIPRFFVILAICSVGVVAIGWYVNRIALGGARGDEMVLCSVDLIQDNISSCFWGMFDLLGGMAQIKDTRVLSLAGLLRLAKCCLVILMLVSAVVSVKNCIRKKSDLRILLLLSVFAWNLFVLSVSYTKAGSLNFEYRYHLIGIIPLMCVMGIFLIESIQKLQMKQQYFIYTAGLLGILFICAGSYISLYSRPDQTAELKELCAYTKELDVEHIYFLESTGDVAICRLLDEDSSYIYLRDSGVTWALDYYACYIDAPMQTNNVIVVVNPEQYECGDTFEIAGHCLTRLATIANRSLYYFAE